MGTTIAHPDLQIMALLSFLYGKLRADAVLLEEFGSADKIVNGVLARIFVEGENLIMPARQRLPYLALWRSGPGTRGGRYTNLPATNAELMCAWITSVTKGGEDLSAITGMTADGLTKASMEANLVWHRICYNIENASAAENAALYVEDVQPNRCEFLDVGEGYFGFLGTINISHTHPPYLPLDETYDLTTISGSMLEYNYDIDTEEYSVTGFGLDYKEDNLDE